MELPPSSDYTDMGRMSKSPGRNYPNNTVAIVARPGLRPAPISTGIGRRTIPSSYTHTHTDTNCPLLSWHPSLQPDHPMNKNENPKKWMDRKRGREGVGEEGRKTKCLGQDQPGISSYVVPTHWLKLLSFSARSILSPHVPEKTTQTLNDFMI